MNQKDDQGRTCGSAKWGVYAFFDFDGEPIYVGQTKERLGGRVGRHITNQRSDAVAMRILDPLEVAEVEVWPLWHLEKVDGRNKAACDELDSLEFSVWYRAIKGSKFGAILNEKRPPSDKLVDLPTSYRGTLYTGQELEDRKNADVRIARRAETVSRLADVARERGQVSAGLRRTLALQSIRLAYLAAVRSAVADGRPIPSPSAIDSSALVGDQLSLTDDLSESDE
ncbi:GIY-YIG nuclease family protein [Prescottella agglutinans]|nr:GIY-YIG nuclease family protein [Prescottella agglutinans]